MDPSKFVRIFFLSSYGFYFYIYSLHGMATETLKNSN